MEIQDPIQLGAYADPLLPEADPVAMAAIGSRVYTQENYIESGQTITASIDALDRAINEAFVGSIDGGSASSVFLATQETDGGAANTIFVNTINGGTA